MRGRFTIRTDEGQGSSAQEIADKLVARAAAARFPIEPFAGPELSRSFSIFNSVIRRHGFEIQAELARALVRSGQFEIYTNVAVPMPELRGAARRNLSLDLLAINPAARWVGGYEIKRGLGATATSRRNTLENDLVSVRAMLPELARELGHDVSYSTSAIVQYFDVATFRSDLTLRRVDLDEHFEVPVAGAIDGLTEEIGRSLRQAVPLLFRPALVASPEPSETVDRPMGPGAARRGVIKLPSRR